MPHYLLAVVLSVSLFSNQASAHWARPFPPLKFLESWAPDPDLDDITVEGPDSELLAELPSGDTDLRTFRASDLLIRAYSHEYAVPQGELKDHPKATDCSRAEVHALREWATNNVYQEVNRTLRLARKGKVKGTPITQRMEHMILMISSAVNCAPQYEGPVVRMEKLPKAILDQYQVGNFLGMRAFTSTSKGTKPTDYFIEHSEQKVIIENAHGADVDVLQVATWPDEKEVLIRPGTVFRVLSRKDFPPTTVPKIFNEFELRQY